MNDFITRAIVADKLQTQNPAPATTPEWRNLLDAIDDATGSPHTYHRTTMWLRSK